MWHLRDHVDSAAARLFIHSQWYLQSTPPCCGPRRQLYPQHHTHAARGLHSAPKLGNMLSPPPKMQTKYRQDTREHLTHKPYLYQSFPGSQKRRDEGGGEEGERGRRADRARRGKGEVKNEGKGWEGRGLKAHLKNSDFGTPMS